MHVVLISTYELGRQPFGLASPATWLRNAGARVSCLDLAVERLDEQAESEIRCADLVAYYLPMHTATRIAVPLVERVKRINPTAHHCFYGLYASMNEPFLRTLGADTVLGGEFEEGLVALVRRLSVDREVHARGVTLSSAPQGTTSAARPRMNTLAPPQVEPLVSFGKQRFQVPDRSGLPSLDRYARLDVGDGTARLVGYTEATRGCKHLCRHCPIPPVYQGRFRVVQREVVLEDIRQQVAEGAQHVTFGDPDFFNGIGHARAIVTALHERHPDLTYDVTIKVEHLLRHARELPLLKDTGCLFITTAVESFDDRVLALLEKGHTRDDFTRALALCREQGLTLQPTFVPFTPWTSLAAYQDLLSLIAELDLIESVAPIQLAIRLLIPAGSRLLELAEIRRLVGPFDSAALVYPWRHADSGVDRLHAQAQRLVQEATARGESRREIFQHIWDLAGRSSAGAPRPLPDGPERERATIPHLTEAWYC
jgi:radical SAM superfamily enzyme YgiQ (UPF0313 family)